MIQTTALKMEPKAADNIAVMHNLDGSAQRIEHDGSDLALQMIAEHNAGVALGMNLIEKGEPALRRLMSIAELRDYSGQSRDVSRFLLGIYNAPRFPFPLTLLRGLDYSIMDDCLDVLEMDMKACRQEVHRYFNNGGERFEALAKYYKVEAAHGYC